MSLIGGSGSTSPTFVERQHARYVIISAQTLMHRLLAIFAGCFQITIAYSRKLLCYQAAREEVTFEGSEEVRRLHDVDDEAPQVELAL